MVDFLFRAKPDVTDYECVIPHDVMNCLIKIDELIDFAPIGDEWISNWLTPEHDLIIRNSYKYIFEKRSEDQLNNLKEHIVNMKPETGFNNKWFLIYNFLRRISMYEIIPAQKE